jgi:hypothetical protein
MVVEPTREISIVIRSCAPPPALIGLVVLVFTAGIAFAGKPSTQRTASVASKPRLNVPVP